MIGYAMTASVLKKAEATVCAKIACNAVCRKKTEGVFMKNRNKLFGNIAAAAGDTIMAGNGMKSTFFRVDEFYAKKYQEVYEYGRKI